LTALAGCAWTLVESSTMRFSFVCGGTFGPPGVYGIGIYPWPAHGNSLHGYTIISSLLMSIHNHVMSSFVSRSLSFHVNFRHSLTKVGFITRLHAICLPESSHVVNLNANSHFRKHKTQSVVRNQSASPHPGTPKKSPLLPPMHQRYPTPPSHIIAVPKRRHTHV
jgi:hypothetical protein